MFLIDFLIIFQGSVTYWCRNVKLPMLKLCEIQHCPFISCDISVIITTCICHRFSFWVFVCLFLAFFWGVVDGWGWSLAWISFCIQYVRVKSKILPEWYYKTVFVFSLLEWNLKYYQYILENNICVQSVKLKILPVWYYKTILVLRVFFSLPMHLL